MPTPSLPRPRPDRFRTSAPAWPARRHGGGALAGATLALVLVLAACAPDETGDPAAGGDGFPDTTASTLFDFPPVAPRQTVPPTAPLPDTRDVALTPVQGPPTSDPDPIPLEVYGGDATLTGSLAFGGEPVEGATVRLERWIGGRSTFVEVHTSASGGWIAEGIHGGRYVIRAWKGTRLVLEDASAVFLAEDEERAVHLAMVSTAPPTTEADDEADDGSDDEGDDETSDEASGTDGTDEGGTTTTEAD